MKASTTIKILSFVAVAAVAGCAGLTDTSVVRHFAKSPTARDLFFSASRQGTVLAKVYGDPFGASPKSVADTSYRAMADAIIGRKVTFTGNEKAVEQPQNVVVVAFGASPTINGVEMCSGKAPATHAEPADRVTVRAVFCSSGDPLSDAEGVGRNIKGIDDPKFYRLMYSLSNQLLVNLPTQDSCSVADSYCN